MTNQNSTRKSFQAFQDQLCTFSVALSVTSRFVNHQILQCNFVLPLIQLVENHDRPIATPCSTSLSMPVLSVTFISEAKRRPYRWSWQSARVALAYFQSAGFPTAETNNASRHLSVSNALQDQFFRPFAVSFHQIVIVRQAVPAARAQQVLARQRSIQATNKRRSVSS